VEPFSKSIYCECYYSKVDEQKQETKAKTETELQTNPDGSVHLPAGLLERFGITPGSRVRVSPQSSGGLSLVRADPALTKLYIEPTNNCNLSCRTCIRHTWKGPTGFMDMITFNKLIEGAKALSSLKKISFWGFGEPLLHPNIVEMVAQAKQLGVETQLITNGLLLDVKIAKGLVAAGLDSIVVSLDGANEETNADIRIGSNLTTVRENINTLREIRNYNRRSKPEIGIEFVVMRRNVKDLGKLRVLAAGLGASFVFVSNVLPYSEDLKDEILYWNSASRISSEKGTEWNPKLYLPPIDNTENVAEHLSKLMALNEPIINMQTPNQNGRGYCRFVGDGSLVVRWDGEVSPCAALLYSYSCYVLGRKKEIINYSVGNIKKDDITDIWEKEDFVRFRDRVLRFDFSPCTYCSGCDYTETNEEDCYGNHFPVCGDCLWAQGVVQCP